MMKKIILFNLLLLTSSLTLAQDAHLSIYDAAPLHLNPSMTGVFDGQFRIHGQYRTQWRAVNYKPYTTALVSFDASVRKWGFGVQVSNFRAGIGNFNALQGSVSAAYTTSLDKKRYNNLSFGIQAGITQKSVEYQLLSYDNQYTTQNGGGFDMSVNSGEDFSNGQRLFTPVTNAGLMYFYAKQQSFLNPFVGISAFNLVQPRETYFNNANNVLPMRFYGHVGTRINITELFYLIPKALYMHQREFQELTVALDAGYYLKNSDLYILAGAIYRNADAMIFTIGARMDSFIAKVGYDVNVSSLTQASTGRGGFEISFTYMKQKKKPKTEKICPRL